MVVSHDSQPSSQLTQPTLLSFSTRCWELRHPQVSPFELGGKVCHFVAAMSVCAHAKEVKAGLQTKRSVD